MAGIAITPGISEKLRSGRQQPLQGRWRRRPAKKVRRQRGVDVPKTRHSVTVTVESPGQTLEDVLVSAWEDLEAGRRSECPVCRGTMEPNGASGASCGSCGSELF